MLTNIEEDLVVKNRAIIMGADFIVYAGANDIDDEVKKVEIFRNVNFYVRMRCMPGKLEFETDDGNMYAVFGDVSRGTFSSSQRAILASTNMRYKINRDALCEQLITGSIVGNETCFEQIVRVNNGQPVIVDGQCVTFGSLQKYELSIPSAFRSRNACIDFQLMVLRKRFQEIDEMVGERGVSLGLSGGYDSRLLLLLTMDARIPVNAFTYASSDHGGENEIARLVALHTGIRLRTVAIKPIDQLGEMELQRNVEDAIEYYDGRTNETMGSFGDIHTARKQREFVADAVMNLNGLGGELYRNRERLPPYDFALEDWINCYVIGVNGGRAFCSDMARQRFVGRLSWKFNEILGSGQLRRVDRHWARRWYRNVWLPFFAGPRLSAENRVCLSYMPFADGEVSASALAATPFIGSHGEFEAEMIRRLESSVASLPSSYGHGFARSPLKRRAFDLGVSMVPLRARLLRHCAQFKWSHRPKVANERWKASFASALSYLKEFVPAVNIDILMQEEMSRNRILYIAEFMYRHRDNIDASEWNAVV